MEIAYSIEYILAQIAQIQQQTQYLNSAIDGLSHMGDGDSGDSYSPGNLQGQAKAAAFGDMVKARETTNQQMLALYEKMYDDLKPVKPNARPEMLQTLINTVSAADSLDEENAIILRQIGNILAEKI